MGWHDEPDPTWLNLRTICEVWDATLQPPKTSPGNANTGSGVGHDGSEHPLPIPQHAIDARLHTLNVLVDLARMIRDEHGQVGGPVPDGVTTIHHRCALLAGWADWIDQAHPGHAARLDDARRRLERIVYPQRTDRQLIGYCPRPHPDGGGEECGGPVYTYPDPPDVHGRVHYTSAVCRRCRTGAVLDWWAHALDAHTSKPVVTARELVAVVAFELGVATTTSTVRTWVERGVLTPLPDRGPRGVALFDRAAALDALRARHAA